MAVEALGSASSVKIQIFGTDLSEPIVAKARGGAYPEAISKSVSPARLRRFFSRTPSGNYVINRTIRDMCTFARQNVCEDPPFSHLDLISCRNVLIYLGPRLQKKCMPIFHYALNPEGYLMLGTSESVGSAVDLFALRDNKHKIYIKKTSALRPALNFKSRPPAELAVNIPTMASSERDPGSDLQRHVDRVILTRFAPDGVVIDDHMQILQFRGASGRYLEHPAGAASLGLFEMVRPQLALDVRAAVHRAQKEAGTVRRENIKFMRDGQPLLVHIEVMPFRISPRDPQLYLLTFSETADTEAEPEAKKKSRGVRGINKDQIERLNSQLRSNSESLQAIVEEREAANEELKSANEEIQSSNEELQSTNEELETAKEELQSANEELITVNEELANRNGELAVLNNDLVNILSSISIPIVIVDNNLLVRRITTPGERIFNLIPTDVGRPLSNIKPNIDIPNLDSMIREVIKTLSTRECEVTDADGHPQ
ncbi:MAG: PAS domain-containing protein, partial [Verrucomicrobiaceae bacterium]|nr:PAS domain-containing protein [Verrucomicrobiaceae bacterium]